MHHYWNSIAICSELVIIELARVTDSLIDCTSVAHCPLLDMPQMRPVDVPNALDGFEEVVVTHTRTATGTRTKQKIVPIVLPTPGRSGEMSKSKTDSPAIPQRCRARAEMEISTGDLTEFIEDTPVLGGQDYEVPDVIADPSRPTASVCPIPKLHERVDLICSRLQWSNG